jgi:pyruvate dehydrogenase E2 component (dihydrolipoamide acetyltransferase)
MSQVFLLPDLGEGLTEAEVIDWRVAVGDSVEIDQVVIEVETAKATVEVPCPYGGTVSALHARAGEVVPVGRPLITVEAAASAAETYREEEQAGSGNVLIGYGTGGEPRSSRWRRRSGPRAAHSMDEVVADTPAAAPATASLVISPLVRRLAREHGVDLDDVQSTGPGGIVLRDDVERAIAAARAPDATNGSAAPADEVRVALRGARRAVAQKLTRSRQEIPEVTIWVDADATRLLAARDELRSAGVHVNLLGLIAHIAVRGLKRFPQLNSRVDTEAEEVVQLSAVHLGIAVQSDRGLVVPVVRDADRLSLAGMSAAIEDVVERARAGTLSPADLTGGTFTLNNYGVFGVDGSTPIINHPEAGIVGIGRITDRPWAVDGRLELRKVTQLVLAFDHRVCDGGVAGGYLRFVADCVESPIRLLAEGR